MPIARRPTPPTSQIKEHLSLLNSLSAWTDDGLEDEKKEGEDGYRQLRATQTPAEEEEARTPANAMLDVESDNFNLVIGLVIISNAALIGMETDFGRDNLLAQVLESVFNTVFLLEFLMRLRQLGRNYFKEPWNLFDLSLVIIGSTDLWILPLFVFLTGSAPPEVGNSKDGGNDALSAAGEGVVGYNLSAMRLLRILRLMRVLRVIRLFRMFQQLHQIMKAFSKAAQIVALISVIVGILDYVLAIFLTQTIGQNASSWGKREATVSELFGSIPASMRTLILIMTLSDWDNVAAVLVEVVPAPVVFLCFLAYIMVTSYTMTSLITGIITESLITSQADYHMRKLRVMDKKRKALAAELLIFLNEVLEDSLDEEGTVPAEDLKPCVRGDQELLKGLAQIDVSVSENGILSLIDKMSRDGQDRIAVMHFVDKLTNLTGPASASAIADLKYEVSKTDMQLMNLEAKMLGLFCRAFPEEASINGPPKREEDAERTSLQVAAAISKRSSLKTEGSPAAKGRKDSSVRIRFSED